MTRVSVVRDVLVTSSTLKPNGLGVAGTLLATWVTNSEIKMVDMLKRKKWRMYNEFKSYKGQKCSIFD